MRNNCHILELQTLALKRASVLLVVRYVNSLSLDAFSVRSCDLCTTVEINGSITIAGSVAIGVQVLHTIAVLIKSNLYLALESSSALIMILTYTCISTVNSTKHAI